MIELAKKKTGRKGKYHDWLTDEGLIKLEGWARDGLTNEQIAKNIGINPDTLYTWLNKFPELSESLKRGKEVVDRQVENALLKRALGYQFEEETYITVEMSNREFDDRIEAELEVWDEQNPDATEEERNLFIISFPKTKEVLEKRVVKQVSPDTTAQIFWLKNRKPAEWRDKRDVEYSGTVQSNVDLSGLSTEELRKLASLND